MFDIKEGELKMTKFVVEEELEKVKDKETQKLLEEVISCYSNGNYRATIVTLYTTMIYNLLSKINVLSNYYDIPQAKDLIAEISTKKNHAPKSPQWEDTLLQGIKRIHLVSNEEYDELQNLKINRNYAAHPIVSLKADNTIDDYEMKSISRETAADMIRKAFEIVFLRDPVIAININEKIEKDIKNFYDTNGTVGLEDYLCTKYICKMTAKPREILFRFLWKMSFAIDDFEYRQAYVTSLYTLCKSDVEETDADGNVTTVTKSVLYVNVTLKSYRDMISVYGFNSDQVEMLEQIMSPEFMGQLGYAGSGSGGGGGSPGVSSMTEEEINAVLSKITDSRLKTVCSYALHRVGYPYSQELRDSGNYYDCSSLAYYSWKDAGVDISHGGATTAAAEAQGLDEAGKTVSYDQMQPGDLIFYSFTSNGRYKNISHVAVYVGDGKVVEALNENSGVVYRDVASVGKIVVIGRP